jgi:Zn finger protein HypA/HybF involved in hydrogenase expression
MTDEDEISDYLSNVTGYCHCGFELDYNGMEICCPYCGKEIVVEFNTARCEECGWYAMDADLDEIMNP